MEKKKPMTKWLIKLGLRMVSYKTLVDVMASGVAALIDFARRNSSSDGWEKAKKAIKETRNWLTLFDEVYEDDTLTPEEEKRVQDAISKCTATESIYKLLQKEIKS